MTAYDALTRAAEVCEEDARTYGAINLSVTQEHRNRDYAAERALLTAAKRILALRDALPSARNDTPARSFPICKDHVSAEWNQPTLDDASCVLCRLFYLEAQEGLLEEWQQRAKRAEDAIAEVKRPLDEQMARLNATVTKLNAENDALRSETPASGTAKVSDGWKLVPVEPTNEMLDAVVESYSWNEACDLYKRMLAAAPTGNEEGK